ncbi:SRPBCC domain-containing protein [Streptomyces sp. NPDC059176]|uniref:SRPBCC domain-containing protein n=1 Tax=unclassified Streptomyces TaxID=2593676 RepID=UPI0036BB0DAF
MEHEVFVPVPADSLRQTLADPARVARCVPGLQQDADASAGPLAGRLKIRVGGHTITYRGALRITRQDGAFAVEGEGTEARGSGSVKLAVALRLTPVDEGTTLTFAGTARVEGRLAEVSADAVAQAVRRLLGRFASALGTAAADATGSGDGGDTRGAADGSATAGGSEGDDAHPDGGGVRPARDTDAVDPTGGGDGTAVSGAAHDTDGGPEADALDGADGSGTGGPGADDATGSGDEASVFDVDVPPSALDPLGDEVFGEDGEPPAEAAHARRTMIGRSAEEVDHAPPRGRYAPVPPPPPTASGGTLRWVAPAAALAIASAVVVGRALRRRR